MKLLIYSILRFGIILLFSSCAYLTYGVDTIPTGCEVQSYRLPDGSLKYYFIGDNCNQVEREFRDKYN